MNKLVLIRHGQSQWNLQNRFTGWVDVDLTATGVEQARQAGTKLAQEGFDFDICYTSVLKRAIHTLWHVLDTMDRTWLPVIKSWRLNERHYGGLQGLDKAETAQKYGGEQVLQWRRSFDIAPPLLDEQTAAAERQQPRYVRTAAEVPRTECLRDTIARVMPFWQQEIAPQILSGQRVVIAAHGNSIRALVKHLEQISDADILKVNIPNGQPLVYELDDKLAVSAKYYLS